MNAGHDQLQCEDCHLEAPGSFRQQAQATVAFWLGQRHTDVEFGREPVDNGTCLACHERPNDRHPVYRFLEPRFREARQAAAVHECGGCHAEHRGVRVSNDGKFCAQCHDSFELNSDLVQPTHAELAQTEQWGSCLRCHDFHGNHVAEPPTALVDAPSETQVRGYLRGGESVYGAERRYEAARRRP